MATQVKLTIKRGQTSQDVTQAAGSAIGGSDAIEINIDVTDMNLREVCVLLDEAKKAIIDGNWPRT